jgi:Flp pilus assembly pilin Flp
MRKTFSQMWNDDAGIVALEYLLVGTIVGLALVVGLSAVSSAINAELVELGNAILALDQSYQTATQSSCTSYKTGTRTSDTAANINYGEGAPAITTSVSSNVTVCP